MGHGKMGLKSLVFMIAFVSIIIRIHPLYKVTSLTEGFTIHFDTVKSRGDTT